MKNDTFAEESIHVTMFKGGEQNGQGLTKREYFAALAMQSILTYSNSDIATTAKNSVIAADALIRELNK